MCVKTCFSANQLEELLKTSGLLFCTRLMLKGQRLGWAILHPWRSRGLTSKMKSLEGFLLTSSDSLYWSEKIISPHVPVLTADSNWVSWSSSKRTDPPEVIIANSAKRKLRQEELSPLLPVNLAATPSGRDFKTLNEALPQALSSLHSSPSL